MSKESQMNSELEKITTELMEARSKIGFLKKKLLEEETKIVGLRLAKDNLEEAMKRHQASLLPSDEREIREQEIDEEFRRKLPSLLEKV